MVRGSNTCGITTLSGLTLGPPRTGCILSFLTSRSASTAEKISVALSPQVALQLPLACSRDSSWLVADDCLMMVKLVAHFNDWYFWDHTQCLLDIDFGVHQISQS